MEATYPLCHKEPARSKQNTPLGVFGVPKLLVGGFGCDEVVLYGIRELAQQHLSTNERQASTFLDQWEWTTLISTTNLNLYLMKEVTVLCGRNLLVSEKVSCDYNEMFGSEDHGRLYNRERWYFSTDIIFIPAGQGANVNNMTRHSLISPAFYWTLSTKKPGREEGTIWRENVERVK